MGALAAVSPDGRSVKVHVYARDLNTDESSLYSIKPATILLASSPHQIVHIAWDPSGTALVVVDAIGGTNSYTTIICLNRLENYGHYDCPSEDATGTVAGFDWFEPAKPVSLATLIVSGGPLTCSLVWLLSHGAAHGR